MVPYLTLNPSTGLIGITLNNTYFTQLLVGSAGNLTAPNGIFIFFGATILNWFASFPYILFVDYPLQTGGKGYWGYMLLTFNSHQLTGSNPVTIYQDYPTLEYMNMAKSLLITTSNIPVIQEQYPLLEVNTSGNSETTIDVTSNSGKSIITDFSIASNNGVDAQSYIQYLPTAEYRILSLASTNAIDKMQYQLEYQQNSTIIGITWPDNTVLLPELVKYMPVLLSPGQLFNFKMLLRKKHKVIRSAIELST